jgi:hypothetical protein
MIARRRPGREHAVSVGGDQRILVALRNSLEQPRVEPAALDDTFSGDGRHYQDGERIPHPGGQPLHVAECLGVGGG